MLELEQRDRQDHFHRFLIRCLMQRTGSPFTTTFLSSLSFEREKSNISLRTFPIHFPPKSKKKEFKALSWRAQQQREREERGERREERREERRRERGERREQRGERERKKERGDR